MRVFIYSPQREIAELLADNLSDSNTFVLSFPEFSHLYETIKYSKKYPDLLIMDYMVFNHENYKLAESLNKMKIFLPIVWYNDPCPVSPDRVKHWKAQIRMLQCKNYKKDLSYLDDILTRLRDFIECEDIRPYIALMQPPLPLPQKYIKNKIILDEIKKADINTIEVFRERANLPNNLFYLLKVLQRCSPLAINIDDIIREYKKDDKNITAASLQVLMSRLRNAIRKDGICNFLINYEEKRYRFVVFKS